MSNGSKRSKSVGFARHKLYALALDRPFAKLSEDFIVALDEAARFGRYDDVIARFGTHYPYAVTYGSAARMEAEFTQDTLAQWEINGENVNVNAGFSILGFGVSAQGNSYTQTNETNRQLEEASSKRFDAVGGTGSFGEGGHSTGTPYPILADLRPLYELLNPLNFPNEPEMYGKVRTELKIATENYLRQHADRLSYDRLLPEMQEWEFRSRFLRCDLGNNVFDSKTVQMSGGISIHTTTPEGWPEKPVLWPYSSSSRYGSNLANLIRCNGRENGALGINAYFRFDDTGVQRVRGTAEQISQHRFGYIAQLYYSHNGARFEIPKKMEAINFTVSADDPIGKNYGRLLTVYDGSVHPNMSVYTTFTRIR